MSEQLWCCTYPDGSLVVSTLTYWRTEAIGRICEILAPTWMSPMLTIERRRMWRRLYREGYRCVKVTVSEGWDV